MLSEEFQIFCVAPGMSPRVLGCHVPLVENQWTKNIFSMSEIALKRLFNSSSLLGKIIVIFIARCYFIRYDLYKVVEILIKLIEIGVNG